MKAGGSMRMAHVGALVLLVTCAFYAGRCSATLAQDLDTIWGPENVHYNDTAGSVVLALSSDGMGSTIATNATYLFGSYSAEIKLVHGNSAGTVAAFFLISNTDNHDEIDFEFLGNKSGEPYLVHTNFFVNGTGEREQDVYLWFDPTAEFHTYQFLWNHELIVWLVDNIPIRVHKNINNIAPANFPTFRPMVASACIFDASSWATQGGRVPIDYDVAPFNAYLRNFTFSGCKAQGNAVGTCGASYNANWWESSKFQTFNINWSNQLKWVRTHYQQYDYCYDTTRYATPPVECNYDSALA